MPLALVTALTLAAAGVAQETKAPKVIRGVSYVGMTVSDVDASTRVYSSSAELTEVARERLDDIAAFDRLTGANAAADSRLLESANAQLRLMQFEDAETGTPLPTGDWGAVPVNGPGIAHVCYRGDAANETYQKFLSHGVTPLGNPEMVTLNPRFSVTYAYALDADGIMFEVEHLDLSAISTNRPKAGVQWIRHVSVATPDIDRAVSFYSALFETPSPRRAGDENGLSGEPFDQVSGLPGTRVRMAWFQVGNLEFELIQYVSHPTDLPEDSRPLQAPGYNMVMFDVADLAAARKHLEAAGGEVVTEIEPMDGGEVFFGRDLDGNLLGFFVPPSDSPLSSQRFSFSER